MQTEDEQQPHQHAGEPPPTAPAPPVRRTIDPSEPWSAERMRDAAPAEMLRDRPAEDGEHPDGQVGDPPR